VLKLAIYILAVSDAECGWCLGRRKKYGRRR
jgi:hypothetical protein